MLNRPITDLVYYPDKIRNELYLNYIDYNNNGNDIEYIYNLILNNNIYELKQYTKINILSQINNVHIEDICNLFNNFNINE